MYKILLIKPFSFRLCHTYRYIQRFEEKIIIMIDSISDREKRWLFLDEVIIPWKVQSITPMTCTCREMNSRSRLLAMLLPRSFMVAVGSLRAAPELIKDCKTICLPFLLWCMFTSSSESAEDVHSVWWVCTHNYLHCMCVCVRAPYIQNTARC